MDMSQIALIFILTFIFALIYQFMKPENNRKANKPKRSASHEPYTKELRNFIIDYDGFRMCVLPKNLDERRHLFFYIAGEKYRNGIDNYLGEFIGRLVPEPTNAYDHNAIKVEAPDGHHVGYVPQDMTEEVRKQAKRLPCRCCCFIGKDDGYYYSCCYIDTINPI